MAAIKKSQLYSMLWESCNALRGGMDASQYKDYVLVILFVKYISDRAKSGDPDLEEIPEGCTFDDFVKLKNKDNIGEEINKKLEKLASTFALDNVFVNADFNNEDKLGKGKDKVDTITSLIEVFQTGNLDFSSFLFISSPILSLFFSLTKSSKVQPSGISSRSGSPDFARSLIYLTKRMTRT